MRARATPWTAKIDNIDVLGLAFGIGTGSVAATALAPNEALIALPTRSLIVMMDEVSCGCPGQIPMPVSYQDRLAGLARLEIIIP